MNAIQRFEIIGDLYRVATGHLRPGKDSALEESSSEENLARFDQWFAMHAFTDALKAIAVLQASVAELEERLDGCVPPSMEPLHEGDRYYVGYNDCRRDVLAFIENK